MEFNHTAHKELWDWLSKNPSKGKGSWPGWNCNGGSHNPICASCFACEYQEVNNISEECLYACPLIWPHDPCDEFYDWDEAEGKDERIALAEQIRDLPVREGVETI